MRDHTLDALFELLCFQHGDTLSRGRPSRGWRQELYDAMTKQVTTLPKRTVPAAQYDEGYARALAEWTAEVLNDAAWPECATTP